MGNYRFGRPRGSVAQGGPSKSASVSWSREHPHRVVSDLDQPETGRGNPAQGPEALFGVLLERLVRISSMFDPNGLRATLTESVANT